MTNRIDIIELGIPFTDPIADGPTIQTANTKELENGVTITTVLDMVRTARSRGLKAPLLFMGYFNPMMRYGEERLLKECREAGVNGFIMVDLPPEEAVRFRDMCTNAGYVGSLSVTFCLGLSAVEFMLTVNQTVLCPSYCPCHLGIPHEASMQDRRFVHLRCLTNGCYWCDRKLELKPS